jgi:hypothetical protein
MWIYSTLHLFFGWDDHSSPIFFTKAEEFEGLTGLQYGRFNSEMAMAISFLLVISMGLYINHIWSCFSTYN